MTEPHPIAAIDLERDVIEERPDDDENIHGLRRRECWLTDSLQLSTLIHQLRKGAWLPRSFTLSTFSVSIAESAQCPLVRCPARPPPRNQTSLDSKIDIFTPIDGNGDHGWR